MYVCLCVCSDNPWSGQMCQGLFFAAETCVCVCMYLCMHVYTCMYVCVCLCVFSDNSWTCRMCQDLFFAAETCVCMFVCVASSDNKFLTD